MFERVLFDARWIGPHGIGRFATEVFHRIPEMKPLQARTRPSSPLDPLFLSLALASRKPKCFFSPGYNAPTIGSVPFVFTLHDLYFVFAGEQFNRWKRAYFERFVRNACRRARCVLTVSEFSRAQILEWSELDERRVINVGNGVDRSFTPDGPAHAMGKPYLLYVGNRKPHKNLARLFEAFRISGVARDITLLLSGRRDPQTTRLLRACRISNAVGFAGEIADGNLPAYYRGALALVVPSLYEGFGLPALEAMACGTPVVASSSGALPEVLGDCALFMDGRDVDSIAAALRSIVDDDRMRGRLRRSGPTRARSFSWEDTAGGVRNVLADVLGDDLGS